MRFSLLSVLIVLLTGSNAISAMSLVAIPTALRTSDELKLEIPAKSSGEYTLSASKPNRAITIYDTLFLTISRYRLLASSAERYSISLPAPKFIKSEI
ncbi:hypothetical protein [[Clostridium] innocuum]|uniref:hypothetical protein n=1 Tax=Clostridium innocuum TaxID=1522 RepID=UPI0020CA57A5|nr:hypothetical protein [[Clostridium] innocuum]